MQVPSNIMLVHLGARAWLGFLVILWGLVAAAFATLQAKCSLLSVDLDNSK